MMASSTHFEELSAQNGGDIGGRIPSHSKKSGLYSFLNENKIPVDKQKAILDGFTNLAEENKIPVNGHHIITAKTNSTHQIYYIWYPVTNYNNTNYYILMLRFLGPEPSIPPWHVEYNLINGSGIIGTGEQH